MSESSNGCLHPVMRIRRANRLTLPTLNKARADSAWGVWRPISACLLWDRRDPL